MSHIRQTAETLKSLTVLSAGSLDIVVCSLSINFLGLALPIALLQVYDRILPNKSVGTTVILAIGVLVAIGAETLLRSARSSLLNRRSASAEKRLAGGALDHLLASDLAAFEKVGSGTHVERLNAAVTLRERASGLATVALLDLPFAAFYLLALVWLGGWMVLLPVAALAILLPWATRLGRRLHDDLQRLGASEVARSNFVVAALSGLPSIKSFAGEARMARRYESMNEERVDIGRRVELSTHAMMNLSTMVGQGLILANVMVGALLVLGGDLSIGAVAACTLLSGRVLQPFQAATGAWVRMQSLRVAERDANALFAMPARAAEPPSGAAIAGRLSLRNVGYHALFRAVSLEAEPGRPIALVGPSGSGKSVLLSIAAGLETPTEGAVLLDGRPLESYARTDRERAIHLVQQQETLFSGTILENLTGFQPELADAAQVAAIQVGLAHIVLSLPRGFDTFVGDASANALPRGLAQQIAIARSLAASPRVLLFDDADNALDDDADLAVRRALAEVARSAAVIIVSHRPSVLKLASQVYRLADGGLDGNPLATEGAFSEAVA